MKKDKDVHFNINAILPIQPKNFKITHQRNNNSQTNNSPLKNNNNYCSPKQKNNIKLQKIITGKLNINPRNTTNAQDSINSQKKQITKPILKSQQ